MISEQVQKQAVWFHGVAHYPVNVCMHCGEEDDPEGYWAFDEDDDRICRKCEVAERGSEIWIRERLALRDNCQRCGKYYDELNPVCVNAKLHERYTREFHERTI